MSIFALLADTQEMMIERINQVIEGSPHGALRWILVLSIISLVGILWLVHLQHKLARNQVKLAAMIQEISQAKGKWS